MCGGRPYLRECASQFAKPTQSGGSTLPTSTRDILLHMRFVFCSLLLQKGLSDIVTMGDHITSEMVKRGMNMCIAERYRLGKKSVFNGSRST